jgi:dTDP-4-amino-4,6-dideoxygalactose transaminase
VVAHAIALSGNRPRFVDISLSDYNQDLEQLDTAIDSSTRAVVVTHLFGCPADIDCVREIVLRKAALFGHRIFIIQDLAHAFVPTWDGTPVAEAPDVALWGLGISKMITSVFGGMIATSDPAISAELAREQDRLLVNGSWAHSLTRRAYFVAARTALSPRLYGPVRWADDHTELLSRFTKAYHLDDKIRFPADAAVRLTGFEAEIGRLQLHRLDEIVKRRRRLAAFYSEELNGISSLVLPPRRPGSTYSHFAVRVRDRDRYVRGGISQGVHFGQVIDYSIPAFSSYSGFVEGRTFPNSEQCARTMINLPIHAELDLADAQRVVDAIKTIIME